MALPFFVPFFGARKGKLSAFEVWQEYLNQESSKNLSSKALVRDYNIYADAYGTYSGRYNVTYYYTWDSYPDSIPYGVRARLRKTCEGHTRISFITLADRHTIDWNSARMSSRKTAWNNLDAKAARKADTTYGTEADNKALDRSRGRIQTYDYLMHSTTGNRRRKLFTARTLVIITGKRGEAFDNSVKEFEKLAKSLSLGINRVYENVVPFMKAFSPLSLRYEDGIKKKMGNTVLTDEILARLSDYTQGAVGNGRHYLGTSVYSNRPMMYTFKLKGNEAENVGVFGSSGAGKSFLTKGVMAHFLADDNYFVTVFDVEGDEYAYAAQQYDGITLNMAEGQGHYVDPVEISLTGNTATDESAYMSSSNFATDILTAVVSDRKTGEVSKDYTSIIADAVSLMYRKRGVMPNKPETWSRSKGMTLHDVFAEVERMRHIVTEINLYGRSADEIGLSEWERALDTSIRLDKNKGIFIDEVYNDLAEYLTPEGANSYMFSKPISLYEVTVQPFVVCSFGMRSKDWNSVDKRNMTLSMLYAFNIMHRRSIYAKSQSRYHMKVLEEFQRFQDFPGTASAVTTITSGGRKMGDVLFICSNDPIKLIDNDKFSIFPNTQHYIIGGFADSQVKDGLCKRITGLDTYREDLDKILPPVSDSGETSGSVDFNEFMDNPGSANNDTSDRYSRAFLNYFSAGTLVDLVKFNVGDLANNPLFFTGNPPKDGV